MKKSQGFTLIELMITVVVIGILASIAIPNYSEYMTRARRSDATKGLDYLAACQERYFWQTKTYSNNMALLGDCGSTTSPDGFYTLGITDADANGYTLTATATAGPQVSDTPCLVITLTSAGQRTPVVCW